MDKIQIDNLAKTKNGSLIMDEVTFKVHEGEILALVGANGSGKTLVSKVILSLVKKSGGRVLINSKDTAKGIRVHPGSLGTVLAHQNFYPNMSGYKTIQHVANMHSVVFTGGRIINMMRLLGLKKVMHQPVVNYTPSQVSRLKIAVAIASRPEVLILDDPFVNLTDDEARAVRVILKTLADKFKIAIFLTAPNLLGIEEIVDTIAIIDDGMLVCVKTYNEMMSEEAPFTKVCVTTPTPNLTAKTIEHQCGYETNLCGADVIVNTIPANAQKMYETLVSNKIKVYGMRKINRSLNEQFYQLVKNRTQASVDRIVIKSSEAFFDTSDVFYKKKYN